MSQFNNLLINYFDLKDEDEIALLIKITNFFAAFIHQNTPDLESFYKNTPLEERILPATHHIISKFFSIATSTELKNLYLDIPNQKWLSCETKGIIIDTIYDEARFRSSKLTASQEDGELFSLFNGYHQAQEALYELVDGVINSLLSLYEIPNEKFEIKLLSLINEIIPILNKNVDLLNIIWGKEEPNEWIIFLLGSLKLDLNNIHKNTQSRFKSFFSSTEYEKLGRFSPEALQTYLANAASENSNLKEAKILLKAKQEAEFFLSEIANIEEKLNIPLAKLEEVSKQIQIAKFNKTEFANG